MWTTEEIAKSGFATRAVHVGAEKNMYGTLADLSDIHFHI